MSASEVATTKRVDDLADVILEHENKYKAIEEELEKVRRDVFLFEYYNNRILEAQSLGIEKVYDMKNELEQVFSTKDFFVLFGIRVSKIIDYKAFIKTNHEYTIDSQIKGSAFRVLQDGDYTFEVNIIIKDFVGSDFDIIYFYWWSGPDDLFQINGYVHIERGPTNTLKKMKLI